MLVRSFETETQVNRLKNQIEIEKNIESKKWICVIKCFLSLNLYLILVNMENKFWIYTRAVCFLLNTKENINTNMVLI
ncbi:hypothetical protein CNO13_06600 (plasmid) [Borrelia miyamotoi]|uniref:Uncharacterized protein n=1 Tax=Borrelia miyamotoi TaxID=47466 RepID=A0ABY7VLR3_9SPIR|nr:hypothetical protein [Borrelia miyamotoi]WDE70378.1 hypothetical protein CNO12_07250 [Borrelia miyamotoi]WDE71654.1 hypothetical protein CNO13_06600 [Borrelia miyamotoi]WDS49047.1 hypothetical protein EZU71_007680 [Borrelia miyamotoi]WEG99554.1 hypothetical protein EZU69_007120 [Borrelia miyamotoi]WGL35365.1 hypothetical protein CNO09_07325 [Borrelia miyamotoi]